MKLTITLACFMCLGCVKIPGKKPDNLGVTDGKLAACPATPNCVSSQASDPKKKMAALSFQGPTQEALDLLEEVIQDLGGTVVTRTKTYIHAEFASKVFGFVDDLEFHVNAGTGAIDFRSAARVGYSDLGVNRKRMNKITDEFAKRQNKARDRSSGAGEASEE